MKLSFLRFIRFIPAPTVALAIWLLSSRSSVPLPENIFGFDKLAHCVAYTVLAFSLSLLVSRNRFRAAFWCNVLVIFLATILYGALDEFHQSFVPGRDMSVLDWMADVTGAGLGICLSVLSIKQRY